jgi:hypothetical protein
MGSFRPRSCARIGSGARTRFSRPTKRRPPLRRAASSSPARGLGPSLRGASGRCSRVRPGAPGTTSRGTASMSSCSWVDRLPVSLPEQGPAVGLEPRDDVVAKATREGTHGLSIRVGHQANAFVSADVALLAERIERGHHRRVCADRLLERLNHPIVMGIPRCPIASGGEGGCCGLQGCVIRDVHLPVGTEPVSGAVGEVAFDDLQEIANLVWTALMPCQPAISLPVRQAHRLPQ